MINDEYLYMELDIVKGKDPTLDEREGTRKGPSRLHKAEVL